MYEGYAPFRDHRLFYRENGSGQLVLFIHAGVADSRMWVPQLEAVPDGFHFVAYDRRGFGMTEVGREKYADHVDAIKMMDHFSAKSAVVVGCSAGARIALQLAITSPTRVSRLVLIGGDSPGFQPTEPYESPEWPDAVKAFEAGDLARVAELEAEIWGAGNGRTIDDLDNDFVSLLIEMDSIALQSEAARDEARDPGPDLVSGIQTLTTPTLAVVGEHDLPTLIESAHDLASKLSDQSAVVLPATAHIPSLERPEPFNEALFSFLGAH